MNTNQSIDLSWLSPDSPALQVLSQEQINTVFQQYVAARQAREIDPQLRDTSPTTPENCTSTPLNHALSVSSRAPTPPLFTQQTPSNLEIEEEEEEKDKKGWPLQLEETLLVKVREQYVKTRLPTLKAANWNVITDAINSCAHAPTPKVTRKQVICKYKRLKESWRAWNTHLNHCPSGWGRHPVTGVPMAPSKETADDHFKNPRHRRCKPFQKAAPAHMRLLAQILDNNTASGIVAGGIDQELAEEVHGQSSVESSPMLASPVPTIASSRSRSLSVLESVEGSQYERRLLSHSKRSLGDVSTSSTTAKRPKNQRTQTMLSDLLDRNTSRLTDALDSNKDALERVQLLINRLPDWKKMEQKERLVIRRRLTVKLAGDPGMVSLLLTTAVEEIPFYLNELCDQEVFELRVVENSDENSDIEVVGGEVEGRGSYGVEDVDI